jgi:RNase H-like domain found in reverse transcriptase/Integrase zinc binding domain/Reverse transcriptase (RNA-dependent DNA polymerase)
MTNMRRTVTEYHSEIEAFNRRGHKNGDTSDTQTTPSANKDDHANKETTPSTNTSNTQTKKLKTTPSANKDNHANKEIFPRANTDNHANKEATPSANKEVPRNMDDITAPSEHEDPRTHICEHEDSSTQAHIKTAHDEPIRIKAKKKVIFEDSEEQQVHTRVQSMLITQKELYRTSDRTKQLELAATTLCIEFDRNPSTEREEDYQEECLLQAQRKIEQLEELLEDASTRRMEAHTTPDRTIRRTEAQLTEEFDKDVTNHIEGKQQDRLLRIWRSEHHGNTYWMTGYDKVIKEKKVTWGTSHIGHLLHNNSSNNNDNEDDESGNMDSAQVNSTTFSDREQHNAYYRNRRIATPDTREIRLRKASHRRRQLKIHQDNLNRRNPNYKNTDQYVEQQEKSLPYQDFKKWTKHMHDEVHSRLKVATDTIIGKQTRRLNDEEGHKRSLTTLEAATWREHLHTFKDVLRIIDVYKWDKREVSRGRQLLYKMTAACAPDITDALATFQHHKICKNIYRTIADGETILLDQTTSDSKETAQETKRRLKATKQRTARINSCVAMKEDKLLTEPMELHDYHEHLMEIAQMTLAINYLATRAAEDEQELNYKQRMDETLQLHNLNHTRVDYDILIQPFAEAGDNPNKDLTYWSAEARGHKTHTLSKNIIKLPVNEDGGASINVISNELAEFLGAEIKMSKTPIRIKAVDGNITVCRRECHIYLDVKGTDDQGKETTIHMGVPFTIMPGCSCPLLIGSTTMNYFKHSTESEKKTSTYKVRGNKVHIPHMKIADVEDALRRPLHQLCTSLPAMTDEQDIYYRQARDLRHTEQELKNIVREMARFGKDSPNTIEDLLMDFDEDECEMQGTTRVSRITKLPLTDFANGIKKATASENKTEATAKATGLLTRVYNIFARFGKQHHDKSAHEAKVMAAKQVEMPLEQMKTLEEERLKSTRIAIEEAIVIIDEWKNRDGEDDKGDDISELATEWTLDEDETDKPEEFPSQYWKYVQDSQKPLVRSRYERFISNKTRLKELVQDLLTIDICKERPKGFPYVIAQCLANLSRYYQVDEENPELVPDHLFRIRTTTELPIVNKRSQRLGYMERIFMGVKQSEMLAHKQLQKSESDYRSPMMLVPYHDRMKEFIAEFADNPQDALDVAKSPQNRKKIAAFYRFTMDMTMLNAVTRADNHPMPNSLDCLEGFQGHINFSAQDMADGFWNIGLHPDDRHKTAFATHNMLLEWRVCIQGAKNAAVYFARMIQDVFNEAPRNITVFQDDVFTHSKGIKELLIMQQIGYDRLETKCLFFKRSKARLNYPRIKCLGHIVTKEGRAPDPTKIQDILNIATPRSPKDVRILMGLINFNCEYIPHLADILAVLNDISHDEADVINDWKDEIHGAALRKVKHSFTTSPVLALPDMAKRFRIWVDTCTTDGRGVGGVLTQWYGEGEPDLKDISGKGWRPVAYYSKLMNKSQRRYGVTEAEAMGMYDCIMRWAPYLQAGEFDVIVDHKALQYIYSSPKTTANRRILRYALNLQKFTFSVYYKEGAKHLNADAMSRLYQYGDVLEDIDEEEAGNYDVVTQKDIDLLETKVKLDKETGLTMIPSAMIKAAAKELAKTTKVSSLSWRMAHDEDYMSLSTGGPLQDTLTAGDEDPEQQTYNTNVRRVVNEDRIWEDQEEVHYINLLWQAEEGEEQDGDEPTHMYKINRLTGETQFKSLLSQHEEDHTECAIQTCSTKTPSEDSDEDKDYCGECNVRYNTRSKDGSELKRYNKVVGNIPEDITQTAPTINVKAKAIKKNHLKHQTGLTTLKKAMQEDERLAKKTKTMQEDERLANQTKKLLQRMKRAEQEEQLKTLKTQDKQNKREERLTAEAHLKELTTANKMKKRTLNEELLELTRRTKEAASERRTEELKLARQERHAQELIAKERISNDKRQAQLKTRLEAQQYQRTQKLKRTLAKQDAENNSGPKKVIIEGVRDTINETSAKQIEREAGEEKALATGLRIIGGVFEHPKTFRLYEVIYVFYDPKSKQVVANRRPADGELSTSDDSYAYEVEGDTGVEALVHLFMEQAGLTKDTIKWPRSEAEMRAAQCTDPTLEDLITRIEQGEDNEKCRLRGKKVYTLPLESGQRSALRIDIDQDSEGQEDNSGPFGPQPATVIPKVLQQHVLRYFHEGLAHPGKQRMYFSIRSKYYWVGLKEDVESYTGNCRMCKLRKSSSGQGRMPLQRYAVGVRPMQRVHVDLVGPLQKTANGYEYILVAKCAFSQWIEVVPLRGKSAQEVTKAIVDYVILVHGTIEHFITDNGKEFVANLAEAVHKLCNNIHTTTTPYNPQANGKVENQNKTLKDMLSMYVQQHQRDWDSFLPVIVHAYRTTINVATGYSPFRILFGREARQPSEEWIEDFATTNKVDINEYVNDLTQAMLYTWRSVGERTLKNQQQIDYKPPGKHEKIFRPYLVDDLFYLKSIPKRYHTEKGRIKQKITAKLQMRYTGPHRVLEVKNPVLYVALVDGRRKMVHALKMKRDASTAERFVGFEDDMWDDDNEQEIVMEKEDNDDDDEQLMGIKIERQRAETLNDDDADEGDGITMFANKYINKQHDSDSYSDSDSEDSDEEDTSYYAKHKTEEHDTRNQLEMLTRSFSQGE